jgi:hypothetical protein
VFVIGGRHDCQTTERVHIIPGPTLQRAAWIAGRGLSPNEPAAGRVPVVSLVLRDGSPGGRARAGQKHLAGLRPLAAGRNDASADRTTDPGGSDAGGRVWVGTGQRPRTGKGLAGQQLRQTHIHFPVDWVLLCDAVRTLMKATRLICANGLKQRMETPEQFLQAMNRLSLRLTHARRAKDSKKRRKQTLRLTKRQVKVMAEYARRHRQLLDQAWARTDWTRSQAQQILGRIDRVLALLPCAQKKAHERIIGERQVDNADKILSLYETDTRVIVRVKAGAEVEFGTTLLLAEQKDGLIVDWQLNRDSAPADTRQLPESLQRMEKAYGAGVIRALGADRGFSSAANQALLAQKHIYDGICPKHPARLRKRMAEALHMFSTRKRTMTEKCRKLL